MSLTSSRDSWERLVTAVVKRQQIWELCHQQSFTTINSDDLSEQTLSFSSSNFEPSSVPPSPLFPSKNSSISQVKTTGVSDSSSRSVTRKLFSGWYGRKKSKDVDIPAELPAVYLGQLERYSYYQLQVATNKFSDKSFLGRGGFSVVYKGRLIDGTLVAIKRFQIEQTTGGSERAFHREIKVLRIMAEHRNLLSLRGFCMTSKEWFLVYPYMDVNGSVASCLRERPPNVPPLDWWRRKRIARGLSYLHDHCDSKIVHHDVKAANVLLDEEYEAIVGDFSLAKLMDHNDTNVIAAVCGTIGHIAPEYLSTGEISQKTDVFAYGVTILELITGQKAYDLARRANDDDVMLHDWVKGILKDNKLETLVDPNMQGNYEEEEVEQLIQVSLLCTQSSALRRPKMSEVVRRRWLS